MPFAATAPGLFGASTLCSPSICADVHATVRSRLEEGDVDGIVRSRFSSAKSAASAPAGPGSRLLLQMSEVRTMTGESDPLAALTSLLREVGELRELQNRLLQSTNQMSVEAALDSIEDAMRALTELKEAEKAMGATLGLDGWRAVAAEVEAARHLEARIRAFAGVHSKDGGSLEAALRTLQHRERERLSLIQLRNDVLGAAAQIAADNEAREAAGGEAAPAAPAAEEGLKTEAGEPTRTSVKLVRELLEQAASMKALTRTASLTDALTSLKHTPSYAQHELETARRRLRRLHALLLSAARPRAVAAHLGALSASGAAGGGDGAGGDGASALAFAPSAAPPAPSSRRADGDSTRTGNGAAASTSRSADGSIASPRGSPRPEARPLGSGGGGGALASAPEVPDEADEGGAVDEEEEAEPEDDEATLTFGQRAWRRVGQHMALLTGAEAANAGGDAALEIRTRSTPKVPRLPLPPAPANATSAPEAEAPFASAKSSSSSKARASELGVNQLGVNQRLGAPAASARPASPRTKDKSGAVSGATSPRGSPQKPLAIERGPKPPPSKRRPPQHPSSAYAPSATTLAEGAGGGVGGMLGGIIGFGGGFGGGAAGAPSLLCGAAAVDYVPQSVLGVGTASVVLEAALIGTDTTHALCTIELGEAAWDAVHAELKALVALDGAVPGVLKVFGWYERRLSSAPPLRSSSTVEVSVATEIMLGGDLLQRACVVKYTAGHVCALTRQLVSAVSALQAAGVTRVDLAPWSLLYRTPSKGPLAAGLVITNAGFGVPPGARNATSSLRAAFDPPELHGTSTSAPPGAARSAASAVWQLGTLLRLLLTGMMETDSSADALTSVAPREPVALEPDATVLLQALCDPTPGKRAELAQISTYRWMHAHDGKPDDLPLTEAQEGLNRWYDAFLFEGMAARLAHMGSD